MTALAKSADWISPQEYLEGELLSEDRHEYVDGRAGLAAFHQAVESFEDEAGLVVVGGVALDAAVVEKAEDCREIRRLGMNEDNRERREEREEEKTDSSSENFALFASCAVQIPSGGFHDFISNPRLTA